MYFPYFRGRQYELLALKELASQKLISESIIPIVEPIKQIPALKNALKAFNDTGLPIGIIVNPEVGGLVGKSNEIGQKRDQRAEVRSVAEHANAGYETAVDSKLNIISGF